MSNNQVALVTGASRGIGLACAQALAKRGFAVAINSAVDDMELTTALDHLRSAGGLACKVVFDVSDLRTHREALDQIENDLGPISTLVNNAGVSALQRGDILDVSEESYDRCLNVNAKGAFFLTREFASRLVRRQPDLLVGASIVNITSVNAETVSVTRGEYCISKAAASMTSRLFAVRLGEIGVPVYEVRPGLIETAMTSPVIDEYRKRAEAGLCLFPRVGQPTDIGAVVATLASNEFPYVTGQVIHVDGGMSVGRF